MRHPDPDDLALLALGERLDPPINEHLANCQVCSAEVAALRATADLASLSNFGETTRRPGLHVWAAIAAELCLPSASSTGESTHSLVDPPAAGTAQGSAPLPPGTSVGHRGDHGGSPAGPVRRRPRWVAPLAALLVGAALGAGALMLGQSWSNRVHAEATAQLTPVAATPSPPHPGDAELFASGQHQEVRVSAPGLPPIQGGYQVWLFGNSGRLVSLGWLHDGEGTFAVPPSINTQEYRTVDISDQPPDGNPAHSGISVVRGSFGPTS